MKRLLIFGMMTAITSLAILSCKDDFNEEDFLKKQSELKMLQDSVNRRRDKTLLDTLSKNAVQEYIAAANEAGDLMAVTLMVRENGVPLQGVSVSISTGTPATISSGRTKAVQTATTDASGNVVFDRVTIGSGTITFSKTGYITATATVDFPAPSLPKEVTVNVNGSTVTHYLPPAKRFEEATLQMFSATPAVGSVATITGRVTIENDVTNLTPEVPTGTVIRANLTGLVSQQSSGFMSTVQLADNSTLGVGTVAADGTYTMTVPATATAGAAISLIIPNITGTCRMAVNGYDNGTGTAVPLALPEYRDVPTSWGPQATGTGGTAVPIVPGARVVLPSAPAMGSGLGFTFTPVGRSLGITPITSASSFEAPDGTFYKITNRGSYTGAPPTVQINGGGGSGATATAFLRTLLTGITVTAQGSGYAGATIEIVASLSGGGSSILSSVAIGTPGGMVPATLNLNNLTAAGFGPDDAAISLGAAVTGLSINISGGGGTGATATGTFVTELASITITNGGSGYTSAPTFVFGGTGVNTPASVQVVDFPVFWNIEPTNGAGTDYPLVPDVTINYEASAEIDAATSDNVQLLHPNGIVDVASEDLQQALMLSSGDVVKRYSARTYRTTLASSTTPTATVTNEVPTDAKFTFLQGHIDAATGKITAVPDITNFGNGYNARMTASIVPTIAGAPGTGATMSVNYNLPADYTDLSGEWTFDNTPGNAITNPGSGYLRNLNQKAEESSAFGTGPSVQPGKTYIVDIKYGTGTRRAAIN